MMIDIKMLDAFSWMRKHMLHFMYCTVHTQIQWMTDWQTQKAHCPGICDTRYLANTGASV